MNDATNFFSARNAVNRTTKDERTKINGYLEVIKAFAKTTYNSIYVIDYEKNGFDYVADNPLFLCGYKPEEVKEMGYAFFNKHVTPADLRLLMKVNTAGFDFYERLPQNERKECTLSFDFHLQNGRGKTFLVNQKSTPIFFTNTGKLWKALCVVSLSSARTSGNVEIYHSVNDQTHRYDIERNLWKIGKNITLLERETEILQFAARGYTNKEIAETLFLSEETIKFHKSKLFKKLNVSNISEAVVHAANHKLI